jgi:hypothetical protein
MPPPANRVRVDAEGNARSGSWSIMVMTSTARTFLS